MSSVFYYLSFLACGAVLAVLGMGLMNMARGSGLEEGDTVGRAGKSNLSQTLMRWRVGLQFVAIVVIMVTVYLTRG